MVSSALYDLRAERRRDRACRTGTSGGGKQIAMYAGPSAACGSAGRHEVRSGRMTELSGALRTMTQVASGVAPGALPAGRRGNLPRGRNDAACPRAADRLLRGRALHDRRSPARARRRAPESSSACPGRHEDLRPSRSGRRSALRELDVAPCRRLAHLELRRRVRGHRGRYGDERRDAAASADAIVQIRLFICPPRRFDRVCQSVRTVIPSPCRSPLALTHCLLS